MWPVSLRRNRVELGPSLLGSLTSQHIRWTGVCFTSAHYWANSQGNWPNLPSGQRLGGPSLTVPTSRIHGENAGMLQKRFPLHVHTLPLQRPIVCFGGGGVMPGPHHEGSC